MPMQMVCVACFERVSDDIMHNRLGLPSPKTYHPRSKSTSQPFSRFDYIPAKKENNTCSMFPVFLVSAFLTFIIGMSSYLRRITRSSPEEHPVKNTGAPQRRTKHAIIRSLVNQNL